MDILTELEKLRQPHHDCDGDPWYSCPKVKDYCGNGKTCNCGADKHNEILDNIIKHLKEVP